MSSSIIVQKFASAAAQKKAGKSVFYRYISKQVSQRSAPAKAMAQSSYVSFSPFPQMAYSHLTGASSTNTNNTTSGSNSQPFSSASSANESQREFEDDVMSPEWVVELDHLRELASKAPTPLRLRDMYQYANMPNQRLGNAQFLHQELQIRIAQRTVDLLTLPHGLNQSTPIQKVAHLYLKYLRIFQEMSAPTSDEKDEVFTEALREILLSPTSIPMEIARGIATWRDDRREDLAPMETQELEDVLIRFFTARVGLRLMTEHHILSSPRACPTQSERLLRNCKINKQIQIEQQSQQTELGCIQTKYDPVLEVEKVAKEVTRQTVELFGICPEIDIRDCSMKPNTNFTYVPHHLQYIMAELLKNSCKATVQAHSSSNSDAKLPAIRVVIAKGAEDVSIQISDRGGGVPRSVMRQVFQFGFCGGSVSDADWEMSDFGKDTITGDRVRGFGLPLARIYARYFGGELTVKSMEGHGLDAYLYLPRLGDACENLPLSVRASPGGEVSLPKEKNNTAAKTYTNPRNEVERESRRRQALEILAKRAL
mmetsp:Transcript_23668/g.34952  ORF Transcript_23668/g.34952 Transcript_23668/m.34952 type:complete len:540 (-) Transcript_23668:16-1635(-)|eukprot:CAMPEP_0194220842 /NCGR_PEP_ID=MMETSP0156-20130528/29327_1 /TAXON_ID=33649 /ORGANISM="Thalassionema nitzschioides, Strain L26-B" /LENGTH=539 /DNA_ID=CAMNT_0038951047 /DNA_START=138 /DNA_END=1757 /DNA_ORIENTATION=+